MKNKVVVKSSRINRPFCRFKYYLFFRKTTINETNLMDAILVLELQGPLAFPPTVKLIRIIYVFALSINIK